ncbi:glutathione peroxidase [Lacinutrix salivirga]
MNPLKAFIATLFSKTKPRVIDKENLPSLYDITINSLQNKPINLSDFKGKYILFVNVASKCGFTSQYKELQSLYDTHNNKLVVIGVPCNQFGNQEPGDAKTIENFCEVNYGVSFLITEKIKVKGTQTHPLYQWLTQREKNGVSNSNVKWNFQKYLVSPNGELIDYFYSNTSPKSTKITKHLN